MKRFGCMTVGVDLNRSAAVCLARLRSGHSVDLGAYRVCIGLSEDVLCRRCGAESESVRLVNRHGG